MEKMGNTHYRHLLIMAGLSFVSMYILMYSMVDRIAAVYPNFNQFYIAGLMTAPMVIIELIVMRAMYHDKRWNLAIVALRALGLIVFFVSIRQQAAISYVQFLKSMVPHHSGAILMCREASIKDGEIKELCRTIISSQQSEIDQMRAILARLDK